MKTATQILESKGYEGDEITEILSSGNQNFDSLDLQTREHFGIENEPVHLWEKYYLGDADEKKLDKIAIEKGFECYQDLLEAATNHLMNLADSYPSKDKKNDSELKKLAKKFDKFYEPDSDESIETQIRYFWFGLFKCNNADREAELLEFWRNN